MDLLREKKKVNCFNLLFLANLETFYDMALPLEQLS